MRFSRNARLEWLEARQLLTALAVTTTADSGPGSLRQAIIDSNASPGPNTIAFDIGGGGVQTIQPLSALPTVTTAVTIDAETQPGYSGKPLIELDGSLAGGGVDGLDLAASNSTVDGLVVNRFSGTGIVIDALSQGDAIQGNYIGTDVSGTTALGNGGKGIELNGASNNVIGGVAGNVISGNGYDVYIDPTSSQNTISGNLIGTDATGKLAINTSTDSVAVVIAGDNNTVGGMTAAARNVIAGNNDHGVSMQGSNNVVEGNYIGTDITGMAAIANEDDDVEITGSGNTIGGVTAAARNVISGGGGVGISGSAATGNTIEGNYIGTDATGMAALGNSGIDIEGASHNTIGGLTSTPGTGAGNVISGNVSPGADSGGIVIGYFGNSSDNSVEGNIVGLNATGTAALPNSKAGVLIGGDPGDTGNTVGGATAGTGNVISGNGYVGVYVIGGATGTTVAGNFIGTDITGMVALGNGTGVAVIAASGNTIGGTTTAARNVISGNGDGVAIVDSPIPNDPTAGLNFGPAPASGNIVEGNYIGTDVSGTVALGNTFAGVEVASADNTIGVPGAGNVISGTTGNGSGVELNGAAATGDVVQANYIGTNAAGNAPLANASFGVFLVHGASGNTVGGTVSGERNIISGNALGGVLIYQGDNSNNTIEGDYIGTDASGTLAVPNGGGYSGGSLGGVGAGVMIFGANNTVGGTTAGARNLISANNGSGVQIGGSLTFDGVEDGSTATGNLVEGNYIGTDATGATRLPNIDGITIAAANNTIGGLTNSPGSGAGNVISGNTSNNLLISGSGATGNVVEGNLVGLDATGTAALATPGNDDIYLYGASQNTIGGTTPAARNVISGTSLYGAFGNGVEVENASGDVIEGNYIGTDSAGDAAVPNGHGVHIGGGSTNILVGGAVAGAGNLISGNGDGVYIDPTSSQNTVAGNLIGTDATGTVAIETGPMDYTGLVIAGDNDVIGGTTAGARNIISGNTDYGVLIQGNQNVVEGNYVGTDVTGTVALSNSPGIRIDGIDNGRASANVIGGTAAGAGNVISGNNGYGVEIDGGIATGNTIEGNYIGTDATGVAPLPNSDSGVVIVDGASNNTIGVPGAGNIIAYAPGRDAGVEIFSDPPGYTSTGDSIRGNSIFSNGGLGISLNPWGAGSNPTPNHPNGSGVGSNNLENYPVLASATATTSAGTLVIGTLNSTPNTAINIDVYANDVADPSGYGEGQYYLGTISVTTDASGNVSFTSVLPGGAKAGQYVAATATDSAGNTSEFSADVPVLSAGTLAGNGATISATEGTTFSGNVASFRDPDGTGASAYSASVAWGDGNTSVGTITADGQGGFNVSAGHTYAEDGSYTTAITVTDPDGTSVTIAGVANIADAPIAATGATLAATEGASFSGTLGSLTDANPNAAATDYVITVLWGDGQTSAGTATANGSGGFNVVAAHVYAEEGSFTPIVEVVDGGVSTTATAQVNVADAPLSASLASVDAVAGGPFNGVVATFTDADPNGVAGDYSATINWGDGTTSTGNISADPAGGFDVTGTHTYAASGNYNMSVQINDAGGSSVIGTGSADSTSSGLTVYSDQVAGIGFWHNKNGQTLIDSFNGGGSSTALADWLAATLPDLCGAAAAGNNLSGKTNSQVGAFYLTLFAEHGPKLDAEVLATALNVYATTSSLGGALGAQYGFNVTDVGLGASTYDVGSSGAAFGVADGTTLNVYQILQAANQQAVAGVLYGGNSTLRSLANTVFDGINQAGAA